MFCFGSIIILFVSCLLLLLPSFLGVENQVKVLNRPAAVSFKNG